MTVDTNVVIAYLAGESEVVEALTKMRRQGSPLFLSTVGETEILSFPKFSTLELQETERFIEENFASITFDRRVARTAAQIRRTTKIKTPDAAIAATALFTGSTLLTRNVKDFQRVPNPTVQKV